MGAKRFYEGVARRRNTLELIIMTRLLTPTKTHVVLRIILSAGMLAVLLLACSGAVAGATLVVDGVAERLNTYDKVDHR